MSLTPESREDPPPGLSFFGKLGVLAVMAYIVYSYFYQVQDQGVTGEESVHRTHNGAPVSVSRMPDTSGNPESEGCAGLRGERLLAGPRADTSPFCGQKPVIHLAQGDDPALFAELADAAVEEALSWRPMIEVDTLPPACEAPVSRIADSMHPGEIRRLTLPHPGGEKNQPVTWFVKHTGFTPPAPESEMSMRVFTNRLDSSGKMIAACGDTVTVQLVIWDAYGKRIFPLDTDIPYGQLTFTLGGGEMLYGIQRGVLGIDRRVARTLVIPPQFHVVFGAEDAKIDLLSALPRDKVWIVSLMVTDINASP